MKELQAIPEFDFRQLVSATDGEPAALKAKKRGEAFIKRLSSLLPFLTGRDKKNAEFLISEMKENLDACNKQLTGA